MVVVTFPPQLLALGQLAVDEDPDHVDVRVPMMSLVDYRGACVSMLVVGATLHNLAQGTGSLYAHWSL